MKTGNISVALGLSVLSVLYSCNNERFIDETSGEIRQIAVSRNGENGEWAEGTKLLSITGLKHTDMSIRVCGAQRILTRN